MAKHASVVAERKPGVSMMTGTPFWARRHAVEDACSVASSTTGTWPSACCRWAKRAIERCGSASMMVGRRPIKCQCTARQLASVLLPLPPFMVAIVMIELVTLVSPRLDHATNQSKRYYRVLGRMPIASSSPAGARRRLPARRKIRFTYQPKLVHGHRLEL